MKNTTPFSLLRSLPRRPQEIHRKRKFLKTMSGLLAAAGLTALAGCGVRYEGQGYVAGSDPTLGDPLFAAAAKGNLEGLRSALASGRKVDTRDGYGMTPLMFAAKNGHLSAAGLLLDRGAQISLKNVRGESAIYIAASEEETRMVSFLIDRGADVNSSSSSIRWTPLLFAVRSGDLKFVNLLLAKGADPRKQSWGGGSALKLAATWAHLDITRRLLQAGANIDNPDSKGTTPLWELCTHPTLQSLQRPQDRLEVARTLLRSGADPNFACKGRKCYSYRGVTPLMGASERGHADLVSLLIASGADVNARSARGETPLLLAPRNRHDPSHDTVARLLIKAGARE